MKKPIWCLLITIFLFSGCQNSDEKKIIELLEKNDVNTNYDILLKVDPIKRVLQGTMTVHALNDTNESLYHIYFHLYPNAFKEEPTENIEVWGAILGEVSKPGYIDISEVKVDGKAADFQVNDTILAVPLEWKKDQLAKLSMKFEIKVPFNSSAMTYDGNAIWLGNSLPVKSVYDEDGWNLDPYYPIGDPFYNEMANYQVDITVPAGYKVTNTGLDVVPDEKDGKLTYKTEANKVRSYALIVMNDMYDYKESKVGDITVKTWYRQSDDLSKIDILHSENEKSMEFFNKIYGEYPYPEYDVIPTGGFFGGMELPGMTLVQGAYLEYDMNLAISALVHETAHQWWYHLVGNDQIEDPWLDESLTQYSTFRYLQEIGIENYYDLEYSYLIEMDKVKEYSAIQEYIGNSVKEFRSWESYGDLIYTIGPQIFTTIEQNIGTEKMDSILATYYDTYKFKIAKEENLIQTFVAELGPAAETYFEKWLNNEISSFSK